METTMENEDNYMEKNLSRLVKQAGDPARPGKAFTDSLVDSALAELARTSAGESRQNAPFRGRLDRVMAIAAMVAVVFGAAVQIMLTALAWTCPVFAGALFVAMSANWITCVGRLIL
jgi:hypothetical protein